MDEAASPSSLDGETEGDETKLDVLRAAEGSDKLLMLDVAAE